MTELGEIPSEWDVRTINDLIKENIIIDVMDGNHGEIHPKASDYVDIGIPFIMANNLKNGKLDIEDCKFISYEQAKSLRKGFAREGDVLLTHKGTLGETAIVPKLKDEYIMLTPQVTYYRLSDNNVLINRYLKIYFDSKKYQDKLKSFGSQSTRDYVGITEQRKLSIVLPTIEEQEEIASILSTVDEQIDNVDALIEKNKELKKGLMQTLLTKGIGHTKFKKTEIGEIPEEWQVKRLGNVCEVKSSKRVYQSDYIDSGVPFYRSKEIIELSKGNLPTVELFIARDKFEEFKEKYGVPKLGDLMITSVGSVGKTWVCDGREFYYKDGNLTQIISNNEINTKYISYVFECEYLIKQYLGQSSGSAQVALTLEKLKNLLVIFPTIKEQEKIASILSEVDKKIEEYENKKQKLEELKKGLMQQLLTGMIRVTV